MQYQEAAKQIRHYKHTEAPAVHIRVKMLSAAGWQQWNVVPLTPKEGTEKQVFASTGDISLSERSQGSFIKPSSSFKSLHKALS